MGAAPTGGLGAGAITVYGVGDENADAHDAEKRSAVLLNIAQLILWPRSPT